MPIVKRINERKIKFYEPINLNYYYVKPATLIVLCLQIPGIPPRRLTLPERMKILKNEREAQSNKNSFDNDN